jgi:predicted Zn-dependent protease
MRLRERMSRAKARANFRRKARMISIEEHSRTLLAAQGYSELSMFDEALAELGTMPVDAQQHPTAVEMRLIVLMQARRWKSALATGRELTQVAPDKTSGFIHAAFCLHELGKTEEARTLLLSGPETLHTEPVFHYNLACYECVLGNVDVARAHLEKSIMLDKKFRDFAETDPDLKALRNGA